MAITQALVPSEGAVAKQNAAWNGNTVTIALTSGYTYDINSTAAGALAAAVASETTTGGAATWNASTSRAEIPQLSATIAGPVTFDGQATIVSIGGTQYLLGCGNHEEAQMIPSGATQTFYANDSGVDAS